MISCHVARRLFLCAVCFGPLLTVASVLGQLPDRTQSPNAADAGIALSLADQVGAGRGDWFTIHSSDYIITRDPFRAIRRGRQLFQRKFSQRQGMGPIVGDGAGDIGGTRAIGAGLSDSCAGCHGRPRGSAGFGGDVATRPDSRDAPHLFGLGLKEMLADEMTAESARTSARGAATRCSHARFGGAHTAGGEGRQFGLLTAPSRWQRRHRRVWKASTPTCGFAPSSPTAARSRFASSSSARSTPRWACSRRTRSWRRRTTGRVSSRARALVLDGAIDQVEAACRRGPDGGGNEFGSSGRLPGVLPVQLLQAWPGTADRRHHVMSGTTLRSRGLHQLPSGRPADRRDRRVADVETKFDPTRGIFNHLFATATARVVRLGRRLGASNGEAAVAPALRRPQHLHGFEAARPRAELPRAQLRRHDAARVPDDAAVGCGHDRAVRARRAAVRVPPSACSTSQSSVMVRSPSAAMLVTARRLRPISRWISCVRPLCLPLAASRGDARMRGARQHAVFGGDPALVLAAQESGNAFFDAGGAQHARVAELDQHRAFGVLRELTRESHGAQLIGCAAAGTGGHQALPIQRTTAAEVLSLPAPTTLTERSARRTQLFAQRRARRRKCAADVAVIEPAPQAVGAD